MSRPKVVALIVFFAGLALLVSVRPGLSQDDAAYAKWNLLVEVVTNIKQKYVDEVSDEELFRGAIDGMMRVLDPHSTYINAEQLKGLDEETRGSFSGIGIEISMEDGWLTVIAPIMDGPAFKAGVQAGDRIIGIEGDSTEGLSLLDAVKKLRGRKGTKVAITVLHRTTGGTEEFSIVRDDIKLPSVAGIRHLPDGDWDFMIDEKDKIGYVRLVAFQENSVAQLDAAVEKLLAQGMQALVLDLRFNPGGLLESAVEVSDRFLNDGIIVSTRGRSTPPKEYRATKANTYDDFSLIVLVNEWSASASEIVAGAIQDNRRGLLLGQRTFGKGSVQALINLDGGEEGALKLTVAKYYTPSGRSIHRSRPQPRRFPSTTPAPNETAPRKPESKEEAAEEDGGLAPDIEVPMSPEDEVKLQKVWSQAHRSYMQEPASKPATQAADETKDLQGFEDTQLKQALLILKGHGLLSGDK
ncbi:MAG: S41 family peptidase [Planctomycetota bacterium]